MKIDGIVTERLNLRNYEKTDADFVFSISKTGMMKS